MEAQAISSPLGKRKVAILTEEKQNNAAPAKMATSIEFGNLVEQIEQGHYSEDSDSDIWDEDGEPPEYGERDYWDKRYSESDNSLYDWYREYSTCEDLKITIQQYVDKNNKILMVGCGNSQMSEQMYLDGYKSITSIDFSGAAITRMQQRAKKMNLNLEYLEMDARYLTFADESFDTVIDKGTVDAMMCGQNSLPNIATMCKEIYRILKPGEL
jgi:2-polyprenyl-3-methyl-5-hydroxy-6-metoxy-1,4-benzoquinol methylase